MKLSVSSGTISWLSPLYSALLKRASRVFSFLKQIVGIGSVAYYFSPYYPLADEGDFPHLQIDGRLTDGQDKVAPLDPDHND
jgi:hypothetical protein